MLRQAPRYLLRHNPSIFRSVPCRRLVSTSPPAQKSRSWKSSTVRWGLAIGLVYWYNTSNLFAEEAAFPISNPPSPSEETTLPTLNDIRPASRKEVPSSPSSQSSPPAPNPPSSPTLQASPEVTASPGLEGTEEEASSQGAFNEETGEIHWDCPCLGGMAHGPCGEQFRAAFSCFVYSKAEPKGMDCIEHFKSMQTCFRDYPDIYGGELEEEDEQGAEQTSPPAPGEVPAPAPATSAASPRETTSAASTGAYRPSADPGPSASPAMEKPPASPSEREKITERAKAAKEQVDKVHGEATSESDELVPKAAHDAR